MKEKRSRIKRAIYIIVGCSGVGIGAVGTVIPILPTFPFLLLAAICFGKSSERLNKWFMGTKLYQKHLESYAQGRGMTWATKIKIMLMVTLTMTVGFAMMRDVPVGRAVLTVVWVFHVFYFCFGIKTLDAEKEPECEG